jgi:hypothetical protein
MSTTPTPPTPPAKPNPVLAAAALPASGKTLSDVIDAALALTDAPTLTRLVNARRSALAASASETAVAGLTIPAPANAVAICAFLLTKAAAPDYASAYANLKTAILGMQASPPTATWDDVWKALIILPTCVLAATPHLGN